MFKCWYEKNQAKLTPKSLRLQVDPKQYRFYMFADLKYFLTAVKSYIEANFFL
jgi:hypothetical protein